jgi:hypothetical protein
MILSDLLTDANKAGDVAGTFQVLLATRKVDGQELEPGRVQTSDVGLLQIDPSAKEIDILPTHFMEPSGSCLTVADFRSKIESQPELADFALTGVIGFKRLADGGNAQRTNPIIGTYILAEQSQIWLLLYPEQQWPEHWFGA